MKKRLVKKLNNKSLVLLENRTKAGDFEKKKLPRKQQRAFFQTLMRDMNAVKVDKWEREQVNRLWVLLGERIKGAVKQ